MPDLPVDPSGNYDFDPATNKWVPRFNVPPPPPAHADPDLIGYREKTTPGRHTGRNVLALLGAGVVLLLIGGIAAAVGGSSSTATPPSQPPPIVVSPTPEPEVTEPADDAAPDLDVLNDYADLSDNIAATSQEIADAADAVDVDGVLAACSDLASEAVEGTALADTNIPGVDQSWDKAMAHYLKAGSACVAGDFDTAAAQTAKGNRAIQDATAAVNEYAP